LSSAICADNAEALSLSELAAQKAENLDYDEAANLYNEVILTDGAQEETLVKARLALGRIEVIRRNLVDARFHFEWVLTKRPQLVLPDSESPKVRNFFEQVRDEVQQPGGAKTVPADGALGTTAGHVNGANGGNGMGGESERVEDEGLPWAFIGLGGASVVIIVSVAVAAGLTAFLVWRGLPTAGSYDFRTE